MFEVIALLITGFFVGFANGLLGTGGGIILVFSLRYIFKKKELKDVFALALTVTLALSTVSAYIYMKKGNLPINESVKYILPAIIGGFIGAYFLEKIKINWLKKAFGILIITAGLNMIGIF